MSWLRPLERCPDHQFRRLSGTGVAPKQPFSEQVAEEHHALRVAPGEQHELTDGIARIEPLGCEAVDEVGQELIGWQRAKRERVGLSK